MNFVLLSFLPPARLLVVWFLLFIVLTDICCPLFFTRCACATRRGEN